MGDRDTQEGGRLNYTWKVSAKTVKPAKIDHDCVVDNTTNPHAHAGGGKVLVRKATQAKDGIVYNGQARKDHIAWLTIKPAQSVGVIASIKQVVLDSTYLYR